MKLGEIIKIVKDKISARSLSKTEYISTENMIPNFGGVVEASGVPLCKCTKFNKDDVLISNIRPYFKKVWFAKFNGGCSADVLVLRSCSLVDPKYVYYLVANDNFISYYNSSCKGTKMPRGNKDALLEYEVTIPPIDSQQHIVDNNRRYLNA